MAMDLGGAKGGVKSDINVTPLVDVMLVLLIIMMLVAPLLQQGVSVKLPEADQHRRQARHAGPDGHRDRLATRQLYLNAKPVQRRTSWRRRSTSCSRTRRRRSSSSRPTRKSSTARSWPRWTSCGRPASRTSASSPSARSQPAAPAGGTVMAHAHKHLGADKVVRARGPARQRGHERHAAHRRAARAADHLHGGAAADAEGRRHQPAARDEQEGDRRHARRQPDRARLQRPTSRSRSTSSDVRSIELESRLRDIFEQRKDKTMFIIGAGRCATATSSP